MIVGIKKQGGGKEQRFDCFSRVFFSFFFLLFSLSISSQDSIPVAEDFTEEKELKFQEFFFNALSEKAITNYQKAIENLEDCNQISPNNISVFFEFSKNYLLLNNMLLAKEYIDRALLQEPNNIWMLLHLAEIHKKNNNYKEAIKVQERVLKIDPKKANNLVSLYWENSEYEKAISLLNELEESIGLSRDLIKLKEDLKTIEPEQETKRELGNTILEFIANFEETNSFLDLEKLLSKAVEENNQEALFKYSNQGVSLFPAQPFVSLIYGTALNKQGSYKEALKILESGIDFVIENQMEANFYEQIAISYEGIGNEKLGKQYRERARKLKL